MLTSANKHGSYTFPWTNGKTISYTCDGNGLRLTKTVDGVTHYYYYAGDRLVKETYGENTLEFYYDHSGRPYTLVYNGTPYYYMLNLQGDVLCMITGSAQVVAHYTYDPYGRITDSYGSIATINPLRYRGYYQDTETGFYYLQSRYYDPQICRFINADSYASTGQGIIGCNMYAYCNNNPILFRDGDGCEPEKAVDEDGDGVIDYYIYSYTNTTWIFFWEKTYVGYVYIYVGKTRDFFDTPDNYPDGFQQGTDIVIGDFTNYDNPNMYAHQAHLVSSENRAAIIEVMLQYDKDMDTPWERTRSSLELEWRKHDEYSPFSIDAKNIDFDNGEEGKTGWYYDQKALHRGYEKIINMIRDIFG